MSPEVPLHKESRWDKPMIKVAKVKCSAKDTIINACEHDHKTMHNICFHACSQSCMAISCLFPHSSTLIVPLAYLLLTLVTNVVIFRG